MGFFLNSTLWAQMILLAQPDGAPSPEGMFTPLRIITLWVPMGVLFYFLLIRPQGRERANRQSLLDSLKKNDRIVTVGGIYGVVTNVQRDSDEVTIKVDEATNTKLRVTRGSIARVLADQAADQSTSK
jgi:preprotein translocase subunit YajC